MIPDGASSSRRGQNRRPNAAFSLLELLIVAALIITMFTLYWSAGSRNFQTKQLANCQRNLQNIYVALKTYSIDNTNQLPALTNAQTSEPVLSLLIPRATSGTEYFICPGCKDAALPDAQPFANRKISYAYYMGRTLNDGAEAPLMSDRQINTDPKLVGQPIFSADGNKPGANHNKYGGNIMFCDGNVQTSRSNSTFNLTNPPGVIFLNPKP